MLSSLTMLRDFLSIANNNTDTALELCLNGADAAVKRYCKRDFEQQTYTEFYDGTNTTDLVLRQRPVTSVTSVFVDLGGYYGDGVNAFSQPTLTIGSDYVLVRDDGQNSKSGILRRLSDNQLFYPADYPSAGSLTMGRGKSLWLQRSGSIKVVYTAGYITTPGATFNVPLDLIEAVNKLAAWTFRTRKFGGLNIEHEKLGNYEYTLMQLQMGVAPEIGTVRQLLSRYREIAV